MICIEEAQSELKKRINFACASLAKIVLASRLEGQIPEKKYGKFLITGNGDETQESWKPLLNTIPAFGGSSEWFAGTEFGIFLFWNLSTQPNYFSTEKR